MMDCPHGSMHEAPSAAAAQRSFVAGGAAQMRPHQGCTLHDSKLAGLVDNVLLDQPPRDDSAYSTHLNDAEKDLTPSSSQQDREAPSLPAVASALDNNNHTVAGVPAESIFDDLGPGVSFQAGVNQNQAVDEDEDEKESHACSSTGALDNNVHSVAVVSAESTLPANQAEFHDWFQEGYLAFCQEEFFHLYYIPWTSDARRLSRPPPPQKPPPPEPTAAKKRARETDFSAEGSKKCSRQQP